MIKIVAGFFILMVVISAGTVYSLKETTKQLSARKQQLSADLLKDRAAIKVLRAEMAYLSEPGRLQKLSTRFLALSTIKTNQLALSLALSLGSIAGRENIELASYPVDDFPVLLPQDKPAFKKENYDKKIIFVSYPLEQEKNIQKTVVRQGGFYERISLKLGGEE